MEPQQRSFDTLARAMLTYQREDLAPCYQHPEPPLHGFFTHLHDDMLGESAAYRIPADPFVLFFLDPLRTPENMAQHEALKAANMRVRKSFGAYFDFLWGLGLAGTPSCDKLCLPRSEFDRLADELVKKTKNRQYLATLDRCGLSFSQDDQVVVTNRLYNGMPAALTEFATACAQIKDYGFYFFRRCDLEVLQGKTSPDLAAALRMVPQPFQCEVAETDVRLMQMKFRREIFVANYGCVYFIRYSRKDNQVVYWLRILENYQPDLYHHLYWKFKTDLTPRLFDCLEKTTIGLGEQVFDGLKSCIRCYPVEYCMDRTPISWNGKEKIVCKNTGWNKIGHDRSDYESLWTVLSTLNSLL